MSKASITEAINFMNTNIDKIQFFANMYNYVVFERISDDFYSLEPSRGHGGDYPFQLCETKNRKDETTLFFKMSDIKKLDILLFNILNERVKLIQLNIENKRKESRFQITKTTIELSEYQLDWNLKQGMELISVYKNASNEYCYIFKKINGQIMSDINFLGYLESQDAGIMLGQKYMGIAKIKELWICGYITGDISDMNEGDMVPLSWDASVDNFITSLSFDKNPVYKFTPSTYKEACIVVYESLPKDTDTIKIKFFDVELEFDILKIKEKLNNQIKS